jgi:3-dehydroquinate dehydratase-1
MICVSINAENYDDCESYLTQYSFIEFRLDNTKMTDDEIRRLFNASNKLIATCRSGKYDDEMRHKILLNAVKSGASYVDIGYDTDLKRMNELKSVAKKSFCKLIISYHNYENTPEKSYLKNIINESLRMGADIVKIACKPINETDNINLLSLYKNYPKGKLISLGMDNIGRITRVAATFLGAPFTYASVEKDEETAPGQIDVHSLKKIYELMR